MVLYNGTILKVNVRDSSGKYCYCDNVISFEPKFQNKISCFLSRTGKCGDSRGVTGLFCLLQSDESIRQPPRLSIYRERTSRNGNLSWPELAFST